ncbi:MAG: ACT domain-containing protein, partial [Trebonia sp.]
MNQPTLLITLTGRDRPGVTSRLFSALARFPLSVADIEQVTIRGRLVLGVLVACDAPPDLTAIYRAVTELAADLGLEAEITTGSPGRSSRARSNRVNGRLHVTLLGSPLLPHAVAAAAG